MLTPHLFPLAVNGGSGGTDKRERGWGRFKKCNRGHGTGSGLLTTRERREGSRHLPCCVPTAPGAPSFSCHRSDLVGGRRPPRRNAQRPRWLGCFLPSLPLCQSLAAAVRAPPTLCSSHLPAALRAGQPSSCQSPGMGGPPLAALSPEGKLVNIQSSLRDSSSPGPGSDLGIGSFRGSPGNPAGQRSLGTPRRHPF